MKKTTLWIILKSGKWKMSVLRSEQEHFKLCNIQQTQTLDLFTASIIHAALCTLSCLLQLLVFLKTTSVCHIQMRLGTLIQQCCEICSQRKVKKSKCFPTETFVFDVFIKGWSENLQNYLLTSYLKRQSRANSMYLYSQLLFLNVTESNKNRRLFFFFLNPSLS